MPRLPNVLGPGRIRGIYLLATCFLAGCILTLISYGRCCTSPLRNAVYSQNRNSHERPSNKVAIVVAAQTGDNLEWLETFKEWPKYVYTTNDPNAALAVPANKGREGMAYLTYIIDNYDKLPETIIFSHSKRFQWHNDDPLYDGQAILAHLNISYVLTEGYTNLRCGWTLGCPAEIRPKEEASQPAPASDPASEDARAGSFYYEAFEHLFPNTTVPDLVASHCCAQFAVTAETIRKRPVTDYHRYRNWLMETPLRDDLSGRILEYLWHSSSNLTKPSMHLELINIFIQSYLKKPQFTVPMQGNATADFMACVVWNASPKGHVARRILCRNTLYFRTDGRISIGIIVGGM